MLTVCNIRVGYGPVEVLHGVSVNVGPGEIVSVVGPNGAGKTTLLRTISGLEKATSGRIEFNSQAIGKLRPQDITARGIIHCPEGRRLFASMTVAENLKIAAARPGLDKHDWALELDRVVALFPVIRERWHQKAGTLSGGEQQMVALARALVAQPKILLVDELSLGLAPVVIRRVFALLPEIARQGVPILIVDQNAKAALDVAARGYLLIRGHVLQHGSGPWLKTFLEVEHGYFGDRFAGGTTSTPPSCSLKRT